MTVYTLQKPCHDGSPLDTWEIMMSYKQKKEKKININVSTI